MSATSTSNTVAQSVFHILADYDLHHSGNPERPVNAGSPRSHKSAEVEHETPENWPTNHRRVPAYRPVNVHLDRSLRPNGANGVEAMLIATMLNGVRLNAQISTLWRSTGGKVNSRIFRNKIGGEK